jgi:methionyl-tRNA formyltransferase
VKIVFMGTPEFSVPVLDALIAGGHDVVRAYCQPPRIAGRGHKERKTPVHLAAEAHGIDVATPSSFRAPEEVAEFAALDCDAAVVVAYGLILPQAVLDAPRHGCFNLHASLLPRWRGAAPIQRAIMAGDERSGVCVMRMSAGLDEGPVCMSASVDITGQTTAGDLHDALAATGARLMAEAMDRLASDGLECTPQPDTGVTYAHKIDKAEARIAFDGPAETVLRHVHGLSPFPGAWVMLGDGTGKQVRTKVLRCEPADGGGEPGTVLDDRLTIACATGAIRPTVLQREGKGPMELDAFLRGFPIAAGTVLGGA